MTKMQYASDMVLAKLKGFNNVHTQTHTLETKRITQNEERENKRNKTGETNGKRAKQLQKKLL